MPKPKLVVIDPGHGGRDSGAVGRSFGTFEKDVNLRVSLLLRDALRRCGVQVIMTREADIWPSGEPTDGQDLAYRARIANSNRADLFLSWHYDSASDASSNGAAAWIHPSARGKRTNDWATKIVAGITDATGQRNRGVYLGDFQVLRDTNMEAVLIEGGFLSNAAEEAHMKQEDFLQHQAEGAARAICNILGVAYVLANDADVSAALELFVKIFNTVKTAGERTATNFAANAIRKHFGIDVTQSLGMPDSESARLVINHIQSAWKQSFSSGVKDALHVGADALRQQCGIK